MKRDIQKDLEEWKESSGRKPLIIRGARQVGKTWVIRELGRCHFKSFVEINFEQNPEIKFVFDTLVPSEIVKLLSLNLETQIKPGETLLFLDEIQECPRAIMALRYFFEQLPELHVIGAGSLLEFALDSEEIEMPVGRIDFLYMHPLSFGEFLSASGMLELRELLRNVKLDESINPVLEKKSERLLQNYCFAGGMPRASLAMIEDEDLDLVKKEQLSIIQTYRQDFGKYLKKSPPELMERIFRTAPGMVGRKYKYVNVDPNFRAETIRKTLSLLEKAGVVKRVYSTSGQGLPLSYYKKDNMFKILFIDIGLMQQVLGVSKEIYREKNLLDVYRGAVAEQYVGQQLSTFHFWFEERELYYWQRQKPNSQAEVDYLWQTGSRVIPVEVKSGKTGTLKSLHLFLKENESPFGVRFSMLPHGFEKNLLSIPLWGIEGFRNQLEKMPSIR